MKVYVDESEAGMGKTHHAIDRITRNCRKVVLITERKVSFAELEQAIRTSASRHGTSPRIRHINSDNDNRGLSVANEIEMAPARYSECPHVIIIATHAALMRCDFSGFAGWEIVIDEVPAFLDFEGKDTHLDRAYFDHHYVLEQVEQEWHTVTLTDEGRLLSVADVRADQSHAHLAVFHARVMEASRPDAKRYVLCNLRGWAQMASRKVRWCWASVFSLKQLEAFDRVELLGNRFRGNVGSMLAQRLDGTDVEWETLPPLSQTRSFVHRHVEINYFTDRPAARSLFEKPEGQRALKEIGDYLRGVLPAGSAIWTANETAGRGIQSPKELITLPGNDYLKPKQAGTNRYQTLSHAAIIYSAKPCPNLIGLLKVFGIEPEEWTRSIEHEAILQFVTRTSVRDPNNATTVRLWVFDSGQAQYLKDYFDGLAHVTATILCADLDLNLAPKSGGGRPVVVRSPVEEAAHKAALRAKDAARKRKERKKAA
jgi:hypothetical protein